MKINRWIKISLKLKQLEINFMRNHHRLNPFALPLTIAEYQALPENPLENKGLNLLYDTEGNASRKHFGVFGKNTVN